ncbi:MAG: C45 family autoproteolytic acyltransferase/hydrolase [Verrucomicrobia subdivision 3 bacterium]|nr:C45 family autoproteolytic acyltransferase/hydrolase [Limisphaerales bacterium]
MQLRFLAAVLLLAWRGFATEPAPAATPTEVFSATISRILELIEPPPGTATQTFSTRLEFTRAEGISKKFHGATAELAFQASDRLLVTARSGTNSYTLGRNGQQLWGYAPGKNFGVIGEPGEPRFLSAPQKKDQAQLGPLRLPLPREQIVLLPFLMEVTAIAPERLHGSECEVLRAQARPEALKVLSLPKGIFHLWIRQTDRLPARIAYQEGKVDVAVDFLDLRFARPWPPEKWQLRARKSDHIEKTALSHLSRFLSVTFGSIGQSIPGLGEANGERRVVAVEGDGRLEIIDGTRVLFLSGSPDEMGRQQGALMKKQIRNLVDRILYGVGVGSSFAKGKWFFREIEQAQQRLAPHMRPEYVEEMDAMAFASGIEKEEVRLANYFPELFHCSGFALFGDATASGRMFHGRVLDYLRGVGLEQNAVVIVAKPDKGNAWVNVSYAGFVGSVTAMNEKHVAIGEMGGRGEGNWDGKPMAQLVREVMERANTIDEAVEIMRKGPRTCEYYYVISDGKSRRAVGIAATPTRFETVWAGQSHPQLPHAIKDAVLLSADQRYLKLVERVKEKYGRIDAEAARDLMKQPVAMTSNIHSVLFAPDTLDFWVANADSKNVASDTRWTHYNLKELLAR